MAEAGDSPPIINTRLFNATLEEVFRAFSDPDVLAHWWGPQGFTNTFHEFDFQPGGIWRFVMHGPDGADYEMERDFLEVVEPERIVLRNEQEGHEFLQTVTLAEETGKTRVTWAMQFDSAEEAERVRSIVEVANEQNLDRLEAQLAVLASQ